MKIICDVTRCENNTAKLVSDKEGECKCDCIKLSHFTHSFSDKKNAVDCENYSNGCKPFGEYHDSNY
jgi:hypothetical protein